MDKAEWQVVPGTGTPRKNIAEYQTAVWVRGNQTFSIAQLNSPQFEELFVALSSP
jgi:hypothetical protein